jgi:hypothetical protein
MAETKQKTKQATCPTHGSVQATKDVPVFSPPGVFWAMKSLGSPLKPYRCPQCGERLS